MHVYILPNFQDIDNPIVILYNRYMDKDWYDVTLEDIKNPDDLQAALDNAFNAGIETGEEEGYIEGKEEGYNEGIYSSVVDDRVEEARKEGYVKGVEREQNRIHEVIKMHMKWAEEQNKVIGIACFIGAFIAGWFARK
jgi:flagellar biosynthesis/type III secretory pathway protein FliH